MLNTKTKYTAIAANLSESQLTQPLQQKLARASVRVDTRPFYDLISESFGYSRELYNWAQLRAVADGLDSQRTWLCADPINLAVDLAHIYSHGSDGLNISIQEIQEYTQQINAELPDTVELVAPHPLRWYLSLSRRLDVKCHYPDEILGHTLLDKLPMGRDALQVKSLFNELQMILHEIPVNIRRRSSDEPAVDALWLWGCGVEFKPLDHKCWDYIVTRDPLVQSLAQLNGIDYGTKLDGHSGRVLIVGDDLIQGELPLRFVKELYCANKYYQLKKHGWLW